MVRFCVVFFLEFKLIEIKSVLISVKGFLKKNDNQHICHIYILQILL